LLAQQLATAPLAAPPSASPPAATPGAPAAPPAPDSPLSGLAAGERLLVRVLAVQPPTPATTLGAPPAATSGAAPATPTAAATTAAAATTTATSLATAATGAATPTSGAAQIQAAALGAAPARPGQPAVTNPTALATQQAAASAPTPAAPGAVPPIVRSDAGAVVRAEAPPAPATPLAATAAAPASATTAAAAAATASLDAAPAVAPAPFSATVVGTSTNGQPILLAGQNLLTVRAAAVPTGSTLVLALADAPGAAAAAADLAPPAALPAATLPSLPELMRAAQSVGGAAQAAVNAVVPQPGPALAAQAVFYLAALQGGDIRSWIGEPARAGLTRAGRGAALEKVGNELKQASDSETTSRSANAGEWRAQTIPLNPGPAGAPIEPIRLFLHRSQADDSGNAGGGAAGGKPTRFLLDLDLSRLGKIQLDGFAQPPRFDLIVRSAEPLSDAVRTDLRQLFTDMTSARGLTGQVSFQVAPPIVPDVAPPAPRPGILV
jgi:hypothetical protein